MTTTPLGPVPREPRDPYLAPLLTATLGDRAEPIAPLARFWSGARTGASPTALGLAAAVGVAGAVLLVGSWPGLGVALVALAAWGVATPALVRRRRPGDLVLAGWSALLMLTVAVRAAEWVVALSWVVGLGVAAVALTGGRTATGILSAPFAAAGAVLRAVPWAGHGLRNMVGDQGRSAVRALRTAAVAVTLLVVFGALFASADPVFAALVPRLTFGEVPPRAFVGMVMAVVAAAAIHLAGTGAPWAETTRPAATPARPWEWLVPVAALDLLVLVFLGVWVSALARGDGYIRRETGLTYAQYARQGFGQLVVITALTLVVVALGARTAPLDAPRGPVVARVGLGVLCVGTLGIVASALARMSLYVGAYGLTRLRLLSAWGEVAMGVVVLLVLVAGIRWRGGWLPRAAVHVVAVAMLTLALANPDALVVRYDAAATGLPDGLDVAYLGALSADAVPAVDRLDEPIRSAILLRLDRAPIQGFADWNLGRARAIAVLSGPTNG